MNKFLLIILAALLAGCASAPPRLDNSLSARSQSSRVKFIVIHYTVSDLPRSIKILTEQEVSSHYLLTDEAEPKFYTLVDESRMSNHAGVSSWKTYSNLNPMSVGIEIVNCGFKETPEGRVWCPFTQAQIDQLIPLLKQIVARHNIPPQNILGHSDIAPQRKQDPGPLFPWHQLAAAGLITWPDAAQVAAQRAVFETQLPDVAWFQKKLAQHGYAVPQTGVLDEATRNVMFAFQSKYRPARFDGNPDAESAAILEVLAPTAAPKPVAPVAPVAPAAPAPAAQPAEVR
ncbi:N-acetylmuramoyl-L-alanine amidase [Pseudoduganella aquatica]|uniref:N-acetylmuramoyl-L-alanine amidase n=1 Tax=Pseudoduganella aquatica TaxID=2660641 RepID=A0A7X4H770_9BURK|nr:N-acetylmuramoyl-L-alanine amidase [Pseudoduganella aquatica]MYN05973.1 N-acetylmuramoyl-L-alanine amidase [Pseudoduganella aquatica]